MKFSRLCLSILVFVTAPVFGQQISYFNQGFLRQGNAELDRIYLGITNVFLSAGNNISLTFSNYGSSSYVIIDATGAGGGVSLAQLVSATNNALALATNNDNLIGASATNNDTVVSNGVIAFAISTTNGILPSNVLTNDWSAGAPLIFLTNGVTVAGFSNGFTNNGVTSLSSTNLGDIGTEELIWGIVPAFHMSMGYDRNGNTHGFWANTWQSSATELAIRIGSNTPDFNVARFVGTQGDMYLKGNSTATNGFTGYGRSVITAFTNDLALQKSGTDIDFTGAWTVPPLSNSYIQIGGKEFGVGVIRGITFGWRQSSSVWSPGYIGFADTDTGGLTRGRFSFGTRSVSTDTAPIERLGIEDNGQLTVWGPIIASNNIIVDAAHFLYLSNATPNHVAIINGANSVTNSGLGAVPIDGDGTATTFAQVQALAPGVIVTNGGTTAINYSNNFAVDNSHFLTGNIAALTITNAASAGSRIQITDANKKLVDAAASGAVPIDADGTATTAAQISALVTINSSGFTNNVNKQSANYSIQTTDWLVGLTGAHTATLPTAVGAGGRIYGVICTSAGTNAILTTSSQTINGAAKWTNTAVNKFTWVVSDNANWLVIGQN